MVSVDLARVLAASRTTINARVEAARHRSPRFDVAAFRLFVANDLDPLALAVARSHPERVPEAALAALMFGIESLELGLIGPQARTPWVAQVWLRIAPRLGPVLAVAPRQALATMTNAAARLGDTRGVRTAQWIELMQAVAPALDSLEQLRSVGALCAWRAGMAPLRASALAAADALAPGTALSCLQMTPDCDWSALRATLGHTRWPLFGGDQGAAAWVLGGFTGLGGPFARPPALAASSSGFVITSGERRFQVEADAFGATILPAGGDAASLRSGPPSHATVRAARGLAERLGVPDTDLILCESGDSVAVASPWSHRLLVAPRPC